MRRRLGHARKRLRRAWRRTRRLSKPLKRVLSSKKEALEDRSTRRVHRWIVQLTLKHLHGPRKLPYALDELVVVCVVRNGRSYIGSFINHYLSLGAKHIVFLDNDSDDDTVAAARDHEHVTVVQSKLPFDKYGFAMKEYLISRFGKGRWSLCADIDELFDYPYSDVVSLSSLLTYLNRKSYTAVVTQMLDMFPNRALSSRVSQNDEPLKERYPFYDVSNIARRDYYRGPPGRGSCMISNDNIKIFRDGIRKTYFDVSLLLTKHSLILFDGSVRHRGGRGLHRVENARVADFSCVLCHYRLVDGFQERITEDVRNRGDNRQYTMAHEALKQNPNIEVKQDTAQKLKSVNELIDNGFLVVSDEYKRWAATASRRRRGGTS